MSNQAEPELQMCKFRCVWTISDVLLRDIPFTFN